MGDFGSADPDAVAVESGRQVQAGQWVGVRNGQVVAPDTWVDGQGYLRSSGDDSYVAWRWGPANCRISLRPKTIVFDPKTGAPWCAHCFDIRNAYLDEKKKETDVAVEEEETRDRLRKMFG